MALSKELPLVYSDFTETYEDENGDLLNLINQEFKLSVSGPNYKTWEIRNIDNILKNNRFNINIACSRFLHACICKVKNERYCRCSRIITNSFINGLKISQ